MRRYLPSIKKYLWIAIVCTVLAALAGFAVVKAQTVAYQASSTLFVNATAPGTSITLSGNGASSTDSLNQASAYAAEIPTQVIMEYVYKSDPRIKARGFSVTDLTLDVTAVVPNPTAPNILVTATTPKLQDAVMLANDVAQGFQAYKTQELQNQLNAERQFYQNEYSSYQAQSNKLEAQILSYGSSNDPHISLYQSDRQQVMTLMNNVQQQMNGLAPTVHGDVFILSLATPSSATPTAKTSIVVGVAAAAGLILGLLIMLLMIFLDDRLRADDQVPEKLGMSYLGGVSSNTEIKVGSIPTTGQLAQQMADIAVNLHLTGVLPGPWRSPQGSVLLITSAQPVEGKTTVAVSLASSMARAGRSVLVIDGDLRKPATHLALGATPSAFGLTNLLTGNGSENLDNAVQSTGTRGVWLLSAGNPTDDGTLLLDQKLPAILAQLRKKVDVIIIDGPSLLSGADASVMATAVDGIALVVDARYDKLKLLLRARDILYSVAQKPMGVIINRQPAAKRNPYYTVTYNEEAFAGNVVEAKKYGSNGNGQVAGNGQSVETGMALPAGPAYGPPSGAPVVAGRPVATQQMPMDFPVMQPNPNPASPFPSQRRNDMAPPQL